MRPAACTASTTRMPPAALTSAAISAIGWMTPVSLLAAWIATSGRPSVRDHGVRVRRPALRDRARHRASTGSTSTLIPGKAPAGQQARMIGRGHIEPRHANRAAAHLPVGREQRRCRLGGAGGEDDMLGPRADQRGDRRALPASIRRRAARPSPWTDDGLASTSSAASIAARAAGKQRCAGIVIEIGACSGHSSSNRLSLRRCGSGSFISLNFQGQPSYLPALPTGWHRHPVLNNSKLASMETLAPRQGRSVGVPDAERMVD